MTGLFATALHCPLCLAGDCCAWAQDQRRSYWRCATCQLIFADPASLLAADAELAVYQHHQNDPADSRYRGFLARLATPLLQRLGRSGLAGLDFGSGPGPTLSLMLEEAGQQMAIFDPYFANDPAVLRQHYDFICATEAIEHFYQPAQEWALWLQMLQPGGWLALMTKLTDEVDFASWHYKNDPTHVSFFSRATFQYLAERDGFLLEFIAADVILLQRCPALSKCEQQN